MRSHIDISQLFEYSQLNPIKLQKLIRIQLKQQIPHKLRINRELIILTAMVLQLRVLAHCWFIISAEDRGIECLEHLCFVHAPVCEVTILIL